MQFRAAAEKIGEVIPAPFQIKFAFRPSGRQPDIMFTAGENLYRLQKQYVDGTTDLIIEIVSPESLARDTQEKFEEYEKAGVKEYWIIDYGRRTANFCNFDEHGRYKLSSLTSGGKFESRVVEGLWIETDWLWQEELPGLIDVLKEWGLV